MRWHEGSRMLMDCVFFCTCVSFLAFIDSFRSVCASLYGNQMLICMCVLGDGEGSGLLTVCVCPAFSVWLPLSSAKQVVVSAFFICIWWPLWLYCRGHAVIVGRDSKHVAVYNHHSHRAGQCLLHLVISTTDPAHQYKHRCQAAWGIWQDLSASSLRLICCYVPSDLQKLSVLKDTFDLNPSRIPTDTSHLDASRFPSVNQWVQKPVSFSMNVLLIYVFIYLF